MKIDISCVGIDATPAFREYIEEKIGPSGDVVTRFEAKGELTLFFKITRTTKHHTHGEVYRAEAVLELPHRTIHAKAEGSDARAAVDEVKDELKIELRKYKEKALSRVKKEK